MSDMKDICYKCGKVQDYGTMQDISPSRFDILCDACIDEKYFQDLDDRKNAFWRGGNEFHAVEGCSRCNAESAEEYYVCIDHEKEQLEAKGY